MIEKIKRPQQFNNQEMQIPRNIQELMQRYDLDDMQKNIYNLSTELGECLKKIKSIAIDSIYPIGSIYMTVNNTNPSEIFGGKWIAWGTGRTIVGIDTNQAEFDEVEKTGGTKTHKLTIDEMPSHTHQYGDYYGLNPNSTTDMSSVAYNNVTAYPGGETLPTGGSKEHNNLQPYITCYMWKRTA